MEEKLSVNEAKTMLYSQLAQTIGWKYLKSQNCLKKTVKDLIFEIDFFSSKWNRSGEVVDIEAIFIIMYKKYGKERVNNVIAEKTFHPGAESGYWYDISTLTSLDETYHKLKDELVLVVDLCKKFESDYIMATEYLFTELFDEYHVHLDFIAEHLGVDRIKDKAKEIYLKIPQNEVKTYQKIGKELNTMLAKGQYQCLRMEGLQQWMINRNNWKYIIDNHIIEI